MAAATTFLPTSVLPANTTYRTAAVQPKHTIVQCAGCAEVPQEVEVAAAISFFPTSVRPTKTTCGEALTKDSTKDTIDQ
jgi:hypothetical protein